MNNKLGIYVHIPFCRQKCYYCDFASYVFDEKIWDEYIESLLDEITIRGTQIGFRKVDTIFFGGGTPSLMGPERLVKILDRLGKYFVIEENSEITFEANPETVDLSEWQLYRESGFNRVSIGVQSLQENELKSCGRIHSPQKFLEAVVGAQKAGFERINVDLMFGIPEQTFDSFQRTVGEVLALPIEHLSIYGLQIEEGTVFSSWEEQGKLILPSEETVVQMYDWLLEYLPANGFGRYEISNFAKPGGESRHNLKYWHYQPYLGFGSGACGFDGEVRQENPERVSEYVSWVKQLQANPQKIAYEKLTSNQKMAEFCFMGLRTVEGILLKDFYNYFGVYLLDVYGESIKKALKEEWVWVTENRIYPTPLGLKWNNRLGELFLL